MPLYSFSCQACAHEFEALVTPSAEAPACPACGASTLDRLMSAAVGVGGRSAGILRTARTAAAREGHTSNYKRSEIPRK
jgi:putative FmdB family regulatory protein